MITVYDWAIALGAKEEDGAINGAEFARLGLAMVGGCASCQASIGAYNAYPTYFGFWMCKDCVKVNGFESVEELNAFQEGRR